MKDGMRHDDGGWSVLVEKLEAREAFIGIIGLGYVGLPVATAFAEAGFQVLGVDCAPERVAPIKSGHSYVRDVPDEDIASATRSGRLRVTTSYRGLTKADVVLICVPTPLSSGVPDVSAIEAAGRALAKVLSRSTLVVLESTTYPGTTEEFLCPLLESGGLQAGADFLLAYSPERIDPGNPSYGFSDIPKVVGGLTAESTKAAVALYGQVVPKVVTVSGTREAEMAKLIENTFRHVNLALVNELAMYAHEWGVDIWESIEAAATKPFGFMPFWPGPGWGGHCIPLDPSYLSWKVRQDHSHEIRFIELAHKVKDEMPRHVVERASALLNERGKALKGSRVLGVGVAYKSGTEDTRESPGLKVLDGLARRGATVSYHDPLVPDVSLSNKELRSVELDERRLKGSDLVVVLIAQDGIDWKLIAHRAPLVLDCCNALRRNNGRVRRL